MTRVSIFFVSVFVSLMAFQAMPASEPAARPAVVERAIFLSSLLLAGKQVISEKQDQINDPLGGPKEISGEIVVKLSMERLAGSDAEAILQDPLGQQLLEAMQQVVDENLPAIEKEGIGFKGFVPATFARLVAERFNENMDPMATIKLTAPLEMVRNARAKPDEFEQRVFEKVFSQDSWPKGQAYWSDSGEGVHRSRRVMVPEYYTQDCLSCHGGNANEMDITGHPKEGGKLGQLGGALSVSIMYPE